MGNLGQAVSAMSGGTIVCDLCISSPVKLKDRDIGAGRHAIIRLWISVDVDCGCDTA